MPSDAECQTPVVSDMTSERVSQIEPFRAMDIFKRATEIQNSENPPSQRILHLEVGQPSDPPPSPISSALSINPAKQRHHFSYSMALGSLELRSALVSHYKRKYNTAVTPDDIAVTNGASAGFVALFASAFDQGDYVVISSPGYPCYRHILKLFGINVVTVHTTAETNYQPTRQQLEELKAQNKNVRLKGLMLCSPSNPTGSVLSLQELSEYASFCEDMNMLLIVDEVYHGISREPLPSALQVATTANVIILGSVSKYWCMTGFRVGWLVTRHAPLIKAMEKCIQSMAICAPTPCQHAAAVAVDGESETILVERVHRYFKAADILLQKLRPAGFVANQPNGAFYVYADCSKVCERMGIDSASKLCIMLLEQCGVACTPGADFDQLNGEHFIRFSCAGTVEDISEAGDRIVDFVNANS